jgi:23S rRNA (uracil1939-C5)-methyltransferase
LDTDSKANQFNAATAIERIPVLRLSAQLESRPVRLKIEKLVYGGDGLARLPADEHGPGKTVFVPLVLEGEEVEAILAEHKPGFARASLERVAVASPHRVEPGCPYFQRCGGCHYQHAGYEHQIRIKGQILRETLRRTAKVELASELQVHAAQEWGYRNRTRLRVRTAPEFALGYYRLRSHELMPVELCPISSPLINRAIAAVWQRGRARELPAAVRELEFFADHTDALLLVEAYCEPRTSRADAQTAADKLASIMPEVTGVVVFDEPPANQILEPKRLAASGKTEISYQTRLGSYRVSAGAFFQVNRFLINELVDIVTGGASGQLALDLYAGVGLFAVPLAQNFAQVIAVEASQTSYADLRHNAGQEVKAVRATTAQYLDQASGPDLVVADPPRGGLGENVVRSLARLGAPRMTYVSCDPSTLARDLRTLLSLGYWIEGAHMIDLFPQTYHIESVLHLAR